MEGKQASYSVQISDGYAVKRAREWIDKNWKLKG